MHAFILAAALQSFAPTPQAAAVTAVYGVRISPTVARMNVVGRYAAVLPADAMMDGSPVNAPILVERYSFGWQALEVLNFRCRLDSHNFGARINRLLMQGMPAPKDDRPCRGLASDSGPQADVEAVRKLMRGPLVPWVAIARDWAMGEWYGAGGGQTLFRKRGGAWTFVAGGGGAMGVNEMRQYGVPRSIWCALGIYDAKCPAR